MYDLVLQNVRVVDPLNGLDKRGHLVLDKGQVVGVMDEPPAEHCDTLVDLAGLVALPGLIDTHTHVTVLFGGSKGGYRMLAKAGVCTALDLAGPADEAFTLLGDYGAGINVAVLEAVRPGVNLPNEQPSAAELNAAVCASLDEGAIGCKLLGGHFPLTPEASGRFVEETEKEGAYAAWHAGTTRNGNTLDSMRDVLELSAGRKLHLAHVNTYCRGIMDDPAMEARIALNLLLEHPNIYSETYIAETNGTSFALDSEGRMASKATGRTLVRGGYEDSQAGLVRALRDGFAHVFAPLGLETGVYHGEEAVQKLLAGAATGGFDVNPALSRLVLCLGKRPDRSFVTDALGTDGGAIPRNVLVPYGLALVNMGMMTLAEFVAKTSVLPARMLGLERKGHLSPGADADVTIVDPRTCQPVMTVVAGRVVMYNGLVCGQGGTIITTERGCRKAARHGLPLDIVDPARFLPART